MSPSTASAGPSRFRCSAASGRSCPTTLRARGPRPSTTHDFRAQIIDAAHRLHYFANLTGIKNWVRLVIEDGFKTDIVFSFHRAGREPTELLCCSAFLFERVAEATASAGPAERGPAFQLELVCDELFVFTESMPAPELTARFEKWLERSLLIALAAWRKKLGA